MKGIILDVNPTANVLFLECPMYCIQMWNTMKGHEIPWQSTEQRQAFLSTDSKGRYLYQQQDHDDFNVMNFCYQPGTNSQLGHVK